MGKIKITKKQWMSIVHHFYVLKERIEREHLNIPYNDMNSILSKIEDRLNIMREEEFEITSIGGSQ